ncbi:MAG: lyase family protein [Kofleriaceae bacterium]
MVVGVDGLAAALAERAREHAATPMIGRSHGIHAAGHRRADLRAGAPSQAARGGGWSRRGPAAPRSAPCRARSGSTATSDPAIEATALSRLGLAAETVPTQVVARDRHAEVLGALALLGTAIEQIAVGVRHWQRTEVGEAEEGWQGPEGQPASAPQEEPDLSENLCAWPACCKATPAPASRTWRCGTSATSRTRRWSGGDARRHHPRRLHAGARDRAGARAGGARRADADQPRAHRRPVLPEAVLLALVRSGLPRQEAYVMVQRQRAAITEAAAGGVVGALPGRFRALLGADADIAARLSPAALDTCFDLAHHLRHVPVILELGPGGAAP